MAVSLEQILQKFSNLLPSQIKQVSLIFEYSPKSAYRYCQVVTNPQIEDADFTPPPVVIPVRRSQDCRSHSRKWTPEEEQFLKDNWGKLLPEHLEVALQRKYGSIRLKANRLGIRSGNCRAWKPEEIKYLRENYGLLKISIIANNLGRTSSAVKVKAGKIFREGR